MTKDYLVNDYKIYKEGAAAWDRTYCGGCGGEGGGGFIAKSQAFKWPPSFPVIGQEAAATAEGWGRGRGRSRTGRPGRRTKPEEG